MYSLYLVYKAYLMWDSHKVNQKSGGPESAHLNFVLQNIVSSPEPKAHR